jgi:DNA topoisomerase-3
MEKALLIAEKASMMEDIKNAYQHYSHKKYDITFVSANGHLIELFMPDDYEKDWGKPWKKEVLPMIPHKFKTHVLKKEWKRYSNIKALLDSGEYDIVINAGDTGREGELIVDEILTMAKCKLPEFRLWFDDLTTESICKSFDHLLMPQTNLKAAAKLREWTDWLIGMNGSRAVSLSTGVQISVGRVMTAVLAMVVKRDYEIEQFEPETFYECELTINSSKGEFVGKLMNGHDTTKFNKIEDIENILKCAESDGSVIKVEKKLVKTKAPLLHSLSDLQGEAFNEFGYSPDKVLSIAQSLYEKKYLSYPRTDSRYISTNVARELKHNLVALSAIPAFSSYISQITSNRETLAQICVNKNKYVNNSKLTDHHALIPTKNRPDFSTMSKEEKQIYLLVARRLIAIFLPERVTETVKIICGFGEATTITKGSVLKAAGYSEIIPVSSSDTLLPEVTNGDFVEANSAKLKDKKTVPPAPYNYKTLLEAMELAGKEVENKELSDVLKKAKGLGTAATRHEIIKKLCTLNYLENVKKGKSGSLKSSSKGRVVYEILKDTDLVKIEMTAELEQNLSSVENGTYDSKMFYDDMIAYTTRITNQLKALPRINLSLNKDVKEKTRYIDLICPVCGKELLASSNYFYCVGRQNKTCNFILKRELFKAKFSESELAKLLSGRTISKKFTWSSGKQSTKGVKLSIYEKTGTYQYEILFNDSKKEGK